jgi:hypothetical protein
MTTAVSRSLQREGCFSEDESPSNLRHWPGCRTLLSAASAECRLCRALRRRKAERAPYVCDAWRRSVHQENCSKLICADFLAGVDS